jgi:PAS domain S-box-containing protein
MRIAKSLPKKSPRQKARSKARPQLKPRSTPTSGSKYEMLFDQASDAILAILPDGTIDAANLAMEEMSGYLKNELVGSTVDALIPDPARHSSHSHSRLLSLELFFAPGSTGTYEDVAISRKDGYIRYVDLSVRVVSDGRSTRALALFRDITEKKRMERELITKHNELRNAYVQLERKTTEMQAMQETLVQSGKMSALGELAAGIAHELNQPLQGIRGYAQELQSLKTQLPNEADASLKEIVSNVDKMASIIGYLRAWVRKSTENYELTDLHAAIEEALKMLARQFASRGISVVRNFDPNLPKVYANPLQLEQVFINLATNARDAIEAAGKGKGTISISTRAAGNTVEISFRDDGSGMSERTKTKAFNPFFSTKEVGKGMGLGLSISYGILTKLQGSIVVESELGKGAAFLVRIPRDFRELA